MYYKQCWRLHHVLQVKLEYNWVRGQFQNCPRNAFASKNKWTILRIIAISLLKSTVSWQLMSVFAISERERERWPQDDQTQRAADLDHLSTVWVSPADLPPPHLHHHQSVHNLQAGCAGKNISQGSGQRLYEQTQFLCLGFALFIHHNCECLFQCAN